jgi:hypothetical protein
MLVFLTAIVVAPACSKSSQTAKEPRHLTEAQRDSAIAASQLPGASVVGRALEQSDSAKARANQPIPEP